MLRLEIFKYVATTVIFGTRSYITVITHIISLEICMNLAGIDSEYKSEKCNSLILQQQRKDKKTVDATNVSITQDDERKYNKNDVHTSKGGYICYLHYR